MQESIEQYMQTVGQQARQASRVLARASTQTKNDALSAIYTALKNSEAAILAANQIDMAKAHSNNLDSALLDRLELTPARFKGMLQGLNDVISLVDPIGEITDMAYRPSGIQLGKMRVPLGVVGMIYESRPNVTLEAASLALNLVMPLFYVAVRKHLNLTRPLPKRFSTACRFQAYQKQLCK